MLVFAPADAATTPVIDLTKETPAETDNSYNLGPTGALGWMHVEAGMTENSRQILIKAVEIGLPIGFLAGRSGRLRAKQHEASCHSRYREKARC